jgi:hypothetical protein
MKLQFLSRLNWTPAASGGAYMALPAAALFLSTILIPTYGLVGAAWTTDSVSLASCAMLLIILANTMVFK